MPFALGSLRRPKKGDVDKDGKQIKIGKKLGDYKRASPLGLFNSSLGRVVPSVDQTGDWKVRTLHFTQGLALSDHPVDPMKPYNQEGQPISLLRHKAAWRDVHSILDIQPKHNRTVLALAHAARSGIAAPG